ncbi:MAG: prepilin-type cleavage/methylation domain-containing protein, partial [Gammaproteobacteria bacterium]|nr:prepilin-type cleavage/methylation domain-containing protein [Gammaproteobacteria bacterium]
HSNNWASSSSPDELENSDGDIVFVDRIYSGVAGAEYDDLIVWLTPNILKNRMVTAGRLP